MKLGTFKNEKDQNGWYNMQIQNFENFHKFAAFYVTQYQGVFRVAEYEFMVRRRITQNGRWNMATKIWKTYSIRIFYGNRIQQAQKVPNIEFHENPPISWIFRNFASPVTVIVNSQILTSKCLAG